MRLKVAELLAENLVLRSSADRLLDMVEDADGEEVVIDFTGVRSITLAFAHQYILRKKTSAKKIREENLPETVQQMLKIVEKRRQARHELPPFNQPIRLELENDTFINSIPSHTPDVSHPQTLHQAAHRGGEKRETAGAPA